MPSDLVPTDYAAWFADLKSRIHQAQQRATLSVNRELITLYWQLGRDILARQSAQGWGSKVIERLSRDLRTAFPEMKGFSRANLLYMRAFAEAWPEPKIVQQVVGLLPWGHNIVLLTRLKDPEWRLAYARQAVEHGWSRNVLNIQIETQRLERDGKAITNFDMRLPQPQSDLARESLKDPYRLDFLGLGKEAEERAIESALVEHITHFLIELGAGFAFVGRQVPLEVGGDDFFLDLLFYQNINSFNPSQNACKPIFRASKRSKQSSVVRRRRKITRKEAHRDQLRAEDAAPRRGAECPVRRVPPARRSHPQESQRLWILMETFDPIPFEPSRECGMEQAIQANLGGLEYGG